MTISIDLEKFMIKHLLSPDDIVEFLNISKPTVLKNMKEKKMSIKIVKKLKQKYKDITDYLE